jgi:hypothetical protein
MKIRYGFFRDLAARKQDIFFIISFCNISKKVGYFNTRFVLYSIKIKTNIKQKVDRKIRVKVADFFFELGRIQPIHFGLGQSYPAQQIMEKLSTVHVNSGE